MWSNVFIVNQLSLQSAAVLSSLVNGADEANWSTNRNIVFRVELHSLQSSVVVLAVHVFHVVMRVAALKTLPHFTPCYWIAVCE